MCAQLGWGPAITSTQDMARTHLECRAGCYPRPQGAPIPTNQILTSPVTKLIAPRSAQNVTHERNTLPMNQAPRSLNSTTERVEGNVQDPKPRRIPTCAMGRETLDIYVYIYISGSIVSVRTWSNNRTEPQSVLKAEANPNKRHPTVRATQFDGFMESKRYDRILLYYIIKIF